VQNRREFSSAYIYDPVHRRGSRILQGRVSNPSERGTAPPIILIHVTGNKQFLEEILRRILIEEIVGARQSYDI